MTLAHHHRWRVFACAALAINAICFALVRLIPRPEVAFGAALDVSVTVPALYLLLIVRAGLAPAFSVVPLCLLGLLRATWLAPGVDAARPAVSAALEVAVVILVIGRVRRGARAAGGGDLLERIERAAGEMVPSRRAAAILAGELAAFRYAFAGWRCAPEVPAGSWAFSMHRESGVALLFGFLAGVSVMEAVLVHLVVAQWSAPIAWTATAFSIYGAIWLTAVARSFALRPVVVSEEEVIVRAGLLWTVRIPRSSLARDGAAAVPELKLPPLADPKIFLIMAAPVTAHGLYGRMRSVSTIALSLDDPEAFRAALLPGAAQPELRDDGAHRGAANQRGIASSQKRGH